MELSQAISLILHPFVTGVEKSEWADFGCGTGLFTNALAALLFPGSKIYAVDSDTKVFRRINGSWETSIVKMKADFVEDEMNFENLDGILMANSIHFVEDKIPFIEKSRKYLNNKGKLIIVEYNTDKPNRWVPFPLSYESLKNLFQKLQYKLLVKINEVPSIYNRAGIYSALIEC